MPRAKTGRKKRLTIPRQCLACDVPFKTHSLYIRLCRHCREHPRNYYHG